MNSYDSSAYNDWCDPDVTEYAEVHIEITITQLREILRIYSLAQAHIEAAQQPRDLLIHVDGLRAGMVNIKDSVGALYFNLTGIQPDQVKYNS